MSIKAPTKLPVPEFATYAEEAEFWDTHDFTDFDLKPVQVTVAKPLTHVVRLHFDSATLGEIDRQAAQQGVDAERLIRMWVMVRLYGIDHSAK